MKMSQIQVLGPRIWSQVLKNDKDLGPVLDLCPRSQKMYQIQVLDLTFRSQVLENDLDLRPKAKKWSQDQDLSHRKRPRFRPQALD